MNAPLDPRCKRVVKCLAKVEEAMAKEESRKNHFIVDQVSGHSLITSDERRLGFDLKIKFSKCLKFGNVRNPIM